MRLHRAGKSPDWQKVPEAQWNMFQRLAARTGGVLTPANLITLLGLAIVLYGGVAVYTKHYWLGLLCIIIGRAADLLDGWIADRTHTKNVVGEFLDAASDKIATLALLALFLFAHIAPWWVLILMVLPHIIIGLFSAAVWGSGRRLHPSPIGKYTMAAVWVILIGFVLIAALGQSHSVTMTILNILALLTAGVGFYVAAGYIRTGTK